MPFFRRLPSLWRLLREVDLEAIRREAEHPFQVLVCAHELAAAEEMAIRLSGPGPRHPWLLPVEPDQVVRRAASGLIDVAVLRSPTVRLAPDVAGARAALVAAGVPTLIVLDVAGSPMDLVPREGEAARMVLSSALDGAVPLELVEALVAAAPMQIRVALARQLPALRKAVFASLADEAARANAVYALTMGLAEIVPVLGPPLNLADIVVLTKNQLVMSYRIALAAGKQGTPRHLVGEVASVIGGGFLFRQVGRQLVGLVPAVGVVPKVAVAYAGTLAIAKAVTVWASEGHRLSGSAMKEIYRDAARRGRQLARTLLGERKSPPSPS